MYRIVFYCLALLLCTMMVVMAQSEGEKKWKCNDAEKKEIDELVARIMTYGRSDRKFPLNKNELKSYCKEQYQLVAKMESYKDTCLKGRTKQIVSVVLYSMKNLRQMYCKNPNAKRTKDLLDSAACANSASVEYNICNQEFIDLLLAVENHKDSKLRLAQMCCGYQEVFKCVREKGRSKKCTDDHIEANINYIKGYFDNASNLVCGDYTSDSDRCDKVKFIRKKSKSAAKRPQSYFNPLVNLLAHL